MLEYIYYIKEMFYLVNNNLLRSSKKYENFKIKA